MLALGKDVLGLILRECDAVSVCRLRRTCHRLNALGGTESLWAFLLKRDYGVTDPFGSLEAYKDEWAARFQHYKSVRVTIDRALAGGAAGFRCYLRRSRSTVNLIWLMRHMNFGGYIAQISELAVKYYYSVVSIADEFERPPLHYAIFTDEFNIIPFLLEAGADPNLTDENGHTPLDLHFAAHGFFCMCDNYTQQTLHLLLTYGATKMSKQPEYPCERCLKIVKQAWTK